MEYRQLGGAGIKVSRLCLGTNNFGAQVDEETTLRIVKKALDLGVNNFDTANIYTGGRSEELIGKALRGNREDIVIATKVGLTLDEAKPNSTGLSRKHLIWQLKESLKRLQTDYVDLFYLHRFDDETRLEETMTTMDSLVREGMVRYVACSNFSVEQLAEVDRVCGSLGLEKPVAVQPEYNMLKREIEVDLLPYCRKEQLAVLAYSPLAGGFLTGKYRDARSAPPPGSRAASSKDYLNAIRTTGDYATLEMLSKSAVKAGVSMRQLALAWVVRDPVVTSAIVGASTPEQVVENAQALELKVDERSFGLS